MLHCVLLGELWLRVSVSGTIIARDYQEIIEIIKRRRNPGEIAELGQSWVWLERDRSGPLVAGAYTSPDLRTVLTLAGNSCIMGVYDDVRRGQAKMEPKITFRVPRELYDKAKEKAKSEDITLSQILRRHLRRWIEEDPPPKQEG